MPQKTISLKEFIRTGKFGTIEVGKSTKQDVIDLMGENFDFGDFYETQIIKYGWYEFFYWTETEVVFAIQNDHLQFDCSNHNEMIEYENSQIKIDSWFLTVNKDITRSEIMEILTKENIEFTSERFSPNVALEHLKLKNDITIDFSDEIRTWAEDKITGEYERHEEPIAQQKDYVLNGIRLFRY